MRIMPTPAVSQLLYLLDEAFDGTGWHSVLGNLRSVTAEDWSCIPPGGHRTIRDIVHHIGSCKLMYHNHAFGDATLTWEDPLVDGSEPPDTIEPAIERLRDAQERLRQSVASLTDDELFRPRKANWGTSEETRWLISILIQHDLYHAGEINHIRSLCQQNDEWPNYGAEQE